MGSLWQTVTEQHAQAYIAEFYDYERIGDWSTPESSYARRYLRWVLGGREGKAPKFALHGPHQEKRAQQIRDEVDRRLAL